MVRSEDRIRSLWKSKAKLSLLLKSSKSDILGYFFSETFFRVFEKETKLIEEVTEEISHHLEITKTDLVLDLRRNFVKILALV